MANRTNLTTLRVISVFLVVLAVSATAAGGTIYVDADAGGANNGASWTNAYRYLQNGLAAAWSGDEIRVAQGIYKPDEDSAHPNGTGYRTATFRLKNGVAIKGGYAGFGQPDPDARDIEAYETILSGDIGWVDYRWDNSYHVVTGSGTYETAVLDGFTISGGNANGSNPYNRGGGMLNYHGSPTLTNCTFIGNSASYDGGGMYNSESSPTLNNCTFSGNSAEGYAGGGGMYNEENSSPVLTNCTFIGNSAGGDGGGMDNYESSPTLTKCMFSGNSAGWSGGMNNGKNSSPTLTDCTFNNNLAEDGGGMGNDNDSSPTLTNCTFSGNSAGDAGGMFNLASSPTLTNCTFSDNSGDSGGGMFNEESSPTLTNCMFTGNLARWGGGMNNNNSSSPTLTDCMFSSNSAESGGGMSNGQYSNPTLTDCTFSGNSSGGDGGGGMTNGEYSSPTLTNCMFIGNSTAGAGGGINEWEYCSPTLTNCMFTGNLAQWGGGGIDNWRSDPTLINCIFSGNSAESGGGMNNGQSSPTVSNCTFSGNLADWNGGGMYNGDYSNLTVTNCTFIGNSAEYGGGMYNSWWSSPTLTNCRFSGNSATWDGGGIANWDYSSPTLNNCTFSNNSAEYYSGGGMFNLGQSNPTLTNCILWGNTAPSGAQISNDGTSSATVSYSCIQGYGEPAQGMIAHWRFEEGSGNTAYDSVGENDGTLENGPIWTTGQIDGALSFDGADDYVELGTIDGTDDLALAGSNFTICSWIKPNLTGDTHQRIVDKSNNHTGANGYAFFIIPDGRIGVLVAGNDFTSHGSVITAGIWQHVAVTSDGSDYQLYVDGLPVSGWLYGSYSSPPSVSTNMRIGTWNHSTAREFNGSIDEIRIYNRALSAEEIEQLYQSGSEGNQGQGNIGADPRFVGVKIGEPAEDAIAHWKFDEGQGDIAYDSAGNNDGTIYGAQWTTGIIDGALSFDGAGDYAEIAWGESLANVADNFTILLWAQPLSTHQIDPETNSGIGGTSGQKYAIGPRQGNNWWGSGHAGAGISIGTNGISVYEHAAYYMPAVLVWSGSVSGITHVAVVYSDKQPRLYINGESKKTGLRSSKTVHIWPRHIGAHVYGYFKGLIDDVRIYDRALSAEEIQQFYQMDYHLLPDSPCIDVGDNSAVPPSVLTDLDGKSRIINDTVDMGAYEFHRPGILYIDVDAAGANDGSNWANAYNYLQDALAFAWNGDEIRVAQGIYKPDEGGGNTPSDREATFRLKNGVAVKGGYAGFGEPDPNARDIELYETILSGDIGIPGDNSDNSYHVVTGSGTDATAVLDGFTITAGNANQDYPSPYANGGGMYNYTGSSTLTNCTFSGNSAMHYGGGMFNGESSPTVTNCIFSGNSADYGSGMYNYHSSPTVTNCTFSGNSAETGGGMCNWENSSPTVTNCTFSGNSAMTYGGGMSNFDHSSPTVTNCTFSGNSAANYGHGGGMSNFDNSSPTVTNCTFSGNSAGWDGGGMFNYYSSPTLANCILWGNAAPSGPQIHNYGTSSATVSYSDVQGGWPGEGNIDANPLFGTPGSLELLIEEMGMVSYWKFDEGGGTTAYDSAGDNDGTVYGNPVWTIGQLGGALGFDGAGDYVDCGNDSSLNLTNNFSISAWFNLNGAGTMLLICKGNVPAYLSGGAYTIFCNYIKGGLYFYVRKSNDAGSGSAITSVSLNEWIHVVGTFSDGNISIYKNGAFVQSTGLGTPTIYSNNGPLGIGAEGDGGRPFKGIIDEVAIHNRALSDEEIQQLYQIGLTGQNDYHLLPDSPCIDAGDPNYAAEPNETDLDGKPRVIGGRIDMGAYEFNHIPVADAGPEREVGAWPDGIAEVTLDGSGSYDDDGQPLSYLWSWTVGGNTYTATGPTPTIELPVGEQTIELIVNDGIDDSEADEVVITVIEPIEVAMKFTPEALNPDSKGNWVKAHFVLPAAFTIEDVDAHTPATVAPLDIESEYINVFVNEDGLVEIEAAFGRAAFCGAATGSGPVEVTVVGLLTSGQYFYGTDTIKIINKSFEYLGVLASHWLEGGCGAPDWCGGVDLDHNSLVDLVDFAMFDGCCIEVIRQ